MNESQQGSTPSPPIHAGRTSVTCDRFVTSAVQSEHMAIKGRTTQVLLCRLACGAIQRLRLEVLRLLRLEIYRVPRSTSAK